MKCSKCGGEMARGTKTVLGDAFACTRRDQEKPEEPILCRVQPHYCTECGYIEFYKEMKK